MKKYLLGGLFVLAVSQTAFAMNYKVEIQNLTSSAYFTPLLVAAHPATVSLFTVGEPSSVNLQAMAEGGNITGLAQDVADVGGKTVLNPAAGLLAPGKKTVANLGFVGHGNPRLSIVAMLVPSNDAFIGLRNLLLPRTPGVYSIDLKVYDSGTEANDEVRGSGTPGEAGMAVPPPTSPEVGTGATGLANVEAEGFVHVHRGITGDLDFTGGPSDLDAATAAWPTEAVRVTLTVSY
jgi:Spondin_N